MKWSKTLMVVSYARDFLNVVCTDILHLHSRKLTSYKGDFDTFERTATERLRNAKKAAEGQERQRARMHIGVAVQNVVSGRNHVACELDIWYKVLNSSHEQN